MSGLTSFYKQNSAIVENVKYVASDRFTGDDGKPMEWEIRALTSKEDEAIRKQCTKRIPIPGRKGAVQETTDMNLYMGKMAVECTVFPNLKDAELQDSYKVYGTDDLLKEMLTPGEYIDYVAKIQELNGFTRSIDDLSEEIKN